MDTQQIVRGKGTDVMGTRGKQTSTVKDDAASDMQGYTKRMSKPCSSGMCQCAKISSVFIQVPMTTRRQAGGKNQQICQYRNFVPRIHNRSWFSHGQVQKHCEGYKNYSSKSVFRNGSFSFDFCFFFLSFSQPALCPYGPSEGRSKPEFSSNLGDEMM